MWGGSPNGSSSPLFFNKPKQYRRISLHLTSADGGLSRFERYFQRFFPHRERGLGCCGPWSLVVDRGSCRGLHSPTLHTLWLAFSAYTPGLSTHPLQGAVMNESRGESSSSSSSSSSSGGARRGLSNGVGNLSSFSMARQSLSAITTLTATDL